MTDEYQKVVKDAQKVVLAEQRKYVAIRATFDKEMNSLGAEIHELLKSTEAVPLGKPLLRTICSSLTTCRYVYRRTANA